MRGSADRRSCMARAAGALPRTGLRSALTAAASLDLKVMACESVTLTPASSRRALVLPAVALAAPRAHCTPQLRQLLKAAKCRKEDGFFFTVARRRSAAGYASPPAKRSQDAPRAGEAPDLSRVRFHDLPVTARPLCWRPLMCKSPKRRSSSRAPSCALRLTCTVTRSARGQPGG